MPKKINAVFEKVERREALTAQEQNLLANSEAQWDAFKDAEHADEATLERQPVGRAEHVHRDRGLVEVLTRTPDGWRYRSAGDVSVDTGDERDFRPVMSAKVAAALLKRLQATGKKETLPTDAERRARVRSPVDVFDVAALERDYLYFTGLVASGASLWTMEKVAEEHRASSRPSNEETSTSFCSMTRRKRHLVDSTYASVCARTQPAQVSFGPQVRGRRSPTSESHALVTRPVAL